MWTGEWNFVYINDQVLGSSSVKRIKFFKKHVIDLLNKPFNQYQKIKEVFNEK